MSKVVRAHLAQAKESVQGVRRVGGSDPSATGILRAIDSLISAVEEGFPQDDVDGVQEPDPSWEASRVEELAESSWNPGEVEITQVGERQHREAVDRVAGKANESLRKAVLEIARTEKRHADGEITEHERSGIAYLILREVIPHLDRLEDSLPHENSLPLSLEGTIRLGTLIAELEKVEEPGDTRVVFDWGWAIPDVEGIRSYRDDYSQLAISFSSRLGHAGVTVAELVHALKGSIGADFEGYKGGTYTASEKTPIWVADFGECPGTAIVGVRDDGYLVFLQTRAEADRE